MSAFAKAAEGMRLLMGKAAMRTRAALSHAGAKVGSVLATRRDRAFALIALLVTASALSAGCYACDREAEEDMVRSIVVETESDADFSTNPLSELVEGEPEETAVRVDRLDGYGSRDCVVASAVLEERYGNGATAVRTYRMWVLGEGGAVRNRCSLIDASIYIDDVDALSSELGQGCIAEAAFDAVAESRLDDAVADAVRPGCSFELAEPADWLVADSQASFKRILRVASCDGLTVEDEVFCSWDGRELSISSDPDGITTGGKKGEGLWE